MFFRDTKEISSYLGIGREILQGGGILGRVENGDLLLTGIGFLLWGMKWSNCDAFPACGYTKMYLIDMLSKWIEWQSACITHVS